MIVATRLVTKSPGDKRLSVVLACLCSAGMACQDARTPAALQSTSAASAPAKRQAPPGMVLIPAGTFRMGTRDGPSEETPVHEVALASFFIDRTEATVRDFARFVAATGFRTEADHLGWSGVFDPALHGWGPVKGIRRLNRRSRGQEKTKICSLLFSCSPV